MEQENDEAVKCGGSPLKKDIADTAVLRELLSNVWTELFFMRQECKEMTRRAKGLAQRMEAHKMLIVSYKAKLKELERMVDE